MDSQKENEQAQAEAIARQRLKRDAYVALFGPPGKPTPLGEVVLRDLERFVRYGDTAVTRDKTGRYDGGATAYNNGMQDVVKRIHLMIKWSEGHGDSSGNPESGQQ